jgi:pimeloyl-ACP methyl ester carboxylesterase
MALAMSSAFAAPLIGPADASFYDPPAAMSGQHGDLVSYRPTMVKLGEGAVEAKAWNVMYQTLDSDDVAQPVTGTVFVPSAAWAGTGPRPVVIYAVGTHGLGNTCAASKQFAAGTDYEAANVAAALKAGYAVLVSDYVGYTTGGAVRYMAGASQGRNVLDIFRAATQIPGVGISATTKVAIWGYSQGGQAAAWAAELQPKYTPDMPLIGVAHGGTPGDLAATSRYLNGRNGSAFLFSAVMGLNAEYPFDIPFDLAISETGKQRLAKLKDQCLFDAVFDYQNRFMEEFTTGTFTLERMLSIGSVAAVMADQKLGRGAVTVPMYQFHGQADEFIPLNQAFALKQAYCAKGTKVSFDLYPSEHIATVFQAAPKALKWIGDRIAGVPAPDTCANNTPPVTTANDTTGNILFTLDKWRLGGVVRMRTLAQNVVIPSTSTFSGLGDINAKTIVGRINIPKFVAPIKLVGSPIFAALTIEPVSEVTGLLELDRQGLLHEHSSVQVNIKITSLVGTPIGVCRTSSPVTMKLDFDGPIAQLGTQIPFSGSATFPPMTGCIMSSVLTTLMSGPGQKFVFTLTPPPPVAN